MGQEGGDWNAEVAFAYEVWANLGKAWLKSHSFMKLKLIPVPSPFLSNWSSRSSRGERGEQVSHSACGAGRERGRAIGSGRESLYMVDGRSVAAVTLLRGTAQQSSRLGISGQQTIPHSVISRRRKRGPALGAPASSVHPPLWHLPLTTRYSHTNG